MSVDVSPQTPELARARAVLATALRAGDVAEAGDLGALDYGDALVILADVLPPLPLPATVDAGQPVTRVAAIAALREAAAVAVDPSEAVRITDAGCVLIVPERV